MRNYFSRLVLLFALAACGGLPALAQPEPTIIAADTSRELRIRARNPQNPARPVTIPITLRPRNKKNFGELQDISGLKVWEDGEEQEIISVRAVGAADPLYLAVLIQDDVVSGIGNELKGLREFIQSLPAGSRVMVGYLRSGSLQVRQKFTNELDKAAKALRIPAGQAGSAPFNPYVETLEALKKFDAQPKGRRAILLVSDGVDVARGIEDSSPTQSLDLQRTINSAQKRSVAVYCIYAPTSAVAGGNSILIGNGQSSLKRLSDESGGHAFFQGSGAPVSFDPFLKELSTTFARQLVLTYLSTHLKKGYHSIKIQSGNPDLAIEHPAGYTR
jgi:VWFA-related protein